MQNQWQIEVEFLERFWSVFGDQKKLKGAKKEPTGAERESKESQNHKNMTKTVPKIYEKSRLRRGCVLGAFLGGPGGGRIL